VKPITQANLTCPECGTVTLQEMPLDACVIVFDCPRCEARVRPAPGDCCVFCSYADVDCPPIQLERRCCADR
jgi:hypothetical protein